MGSFFQKYVNYTVWLEENDYLSNATWNKDFITELQHYNFANTEQSRQQIIAELQSLIL